MHSELLNWGRISMTTITKSRICSGNSVGVGVRFSLGEASDIEELTPYDFVSLLVKNEQGHAQDESEE